MCVCVCVCVILVTFNLTNGSSVRNYLFAVLSSSKLRQCSVSAVIASRVGLHINFAHFDGC